MQHSNSCRRVLCKPARFYSIQQEHITLTNNLRLSFSFSPSGVIFVHPSVTLNLKPIFHSLMSFYLKHMLQLSSLSACVISIMILYRKSQILQSLLSISLPQQHGQSTNYLNQLDSFPYYSTRYRHCRSQSK